MANQGRIKGKVRWFNNGKNYGLVDGNDGQTYSTHVSQIATHGCGFRSLDTGEDIEFTPAPGDPGKGPQAKSIKRSKEFKRLTGKADTRLEKLPHAFQGTVNVSVAERITFPQLGGPHIRDYHSGGVHAYYLGHPGYITEKALIEVDLPEEIINGNTAIVVTDFNGGIADPHKRFVYDFQLGTFVLFVILGLHQAYAEAKKISVRSQGSAQVIDDHDKVVWLVEESPFKAVLKVPETDDEGELASAIRDQIPDPEGFYKKKPSDSFKKFASAIARCVVELRHVEAQTQSATV